MSNSLPNDKNFRLVQNQNNCRRHVKFGRNDGNVNEKVKSRVGKGENWYWLLDFSPYF